MMQKKKNIQLASILGVLIVLTIATYFLTQSENTTDIDKSTFAIENTLDITKVVFQGNSDVTLELKNNHWVVNEKYDADPQRISVLFAILKQVTARREVSNTKTSEVNKLFDDQGVKVSLYHEDDLIRAFKVTGDSNSAISYMSSEGNDPYIVEIPGYKSYLAGIFQLDVNGWRNPLVFDLNWANLSTVEVNYPKHKENDILITFDDRNLILQGSNRADSSKLGNYIDDISLLYVNDYLSEYEVTDSLIAQLQAQIIIKDIAGNSYSLEVFEKNSSKQYLVRIDSTDFGVMESGLVKKATKPKSYFNQ